MDIWNLTALTYMHVDEWVELFKEVGYKGDEYDFIPRNIPEGVCVASLTSYPPNWVSSL